jgi:DNA-binding CsgD family transcriptional regulator
VSNFLLQAGLQALIKHIGVEPEYIVIRPEDKFNPSDICNANYMIVEQKTFEKNNRLNQLKQHFSGKILFIDNELTYDEHNECTLFLNDSKKIMVGKIQKFFTLQTKNQTSTGNSALSKREIDVLKKVAKGLSNKEISDQLFISKNTVITHRKNITEKLGIKTISGLTVYALMNNLIDPGEITA